MKTGLTTTNYTRKTVTETMFAEMATRQGFQVSKSRTCGQTFLMITKPSDNRITHYFSMNDRGQVSFEFSDSRMHPKRVDDPRHGIRVETLLGFWECVKTVDGKEWARFDDMITLEEEFKMWQMLENGWDYDCENVNNPGTQEYNMRTIWELEQAAFKAGYKLAISKLQGDGIKIL